MVRFRRGTTTLTHTTPHNMRLCSLKCARSRKSPGCACFPLSVRILPPAVTELPTTASHRWRTPVAPYCPSRLLSDLFASRHTSHTTRLTHLDYCWMPPLCHMLDHAHDTLLRILSLPRDHGFLSIEGTRRTSCPALLTLHTMPFASSLLVCPGWSVATPFGMCMQASRTLKASLAYSLIAFSPIRAGRFPHTFSLTPFSKISTILLVIILGLDSVSPTTFTGRPLSACPVGLAGLYLRLPAYGLSPISAGFLDSLLAVPLRRPPLHETHTLCDTYHLLSSWIAPHPQKVVHVCLHNLTISTLTAPGSALLHTSQSLATATTSASCHSDHTFPHPFP